MARRSMPRIGTSSVIDRQAQNVADRAVNGRRARVPSLPNDLPPVSDTLIMLSATPHDGRARSFASLMNMLDPTALPEFQGVYDKKDVEHLFVRRLRRSARDGRSVRQLPRTQGDAGEIMATAVEEEAFDSLTDLKLVMDMHRREAIPSCSRQCLRRVCFHRRQRASRPSTSE